jgi:hypothetical protein
LELKAQKSISSQAVLRTLRLLTAFPHRQTLLERKERLAFFLRSRATSASFREDSHQASFLCRGIASLPPICHSYIILKAQRRGMELANRIFLRYTA